ncbi:hypothetical protein [Spirosoma agri]|uniref:Uncharacterized protein n=1 Tax=Spirosoma agri TaxID=1987381 RepID=A0A6M0IIG7_9BACT|nr:hypothetical protein [Spirosoma agri]NEU67994.1 hypothetical protein [Spirosoma agri]
MKRPESEGEWKTDTGQGPEKPFLVSENDDDVDASGVDDKSTGMGDDDYLGKTNRDDKEEDN